MGQQTCFGETRENLWGLYPGIAKNVLDPDGRGRITVTFDWIAEGYESELAHVAQIYAGADHGAVWTPEEGDQVVVSFLNGQLSNPVVLGSIYNKKNMPLQTRTQQGDPKLFQTKGGHYLLMEDGQGKRIELSDTDGANQVIIDTEANSITVRATQDVTVEAGGNLTLSAGGSIDITASGAITVSGSTISLN